jgi:hypothetical protein
MESEILRRPEEGEAMIKFQRFTINQNVRF